MSKEQKDRPTDPNRLAASIVRDATGDEPPTRAEVDQALDRLEASARAAMDLEALADITIIRDWIAGDGGAQVFGLAPLRKAP